ANFYRYLTGQEQQHQMPAETLVNYARSVLDWSWSPLRQRQLLFQANNAVFSDETNLSAAKLCVIK
ncbi:hypothetical protein HZD82_27290, partial [Pantoea agglomerans]|nr:hypothetical protein [Pantoea agglomerans]